MKHALVSIYNPALLNANTKHHFVQIAISIDGAISLRAELNLFLKQHGVLEH
jgi:hypothetical protein